MGASVFPLVNNILFQHVIFLKFPSLGLGQTEEGKLRVLPRKDSQSQAFSCLDGVAGGGVGGAQSQFPCLMEGLGYVWHKSIGQSLGRKQMVHSKGSLKRVEETINVGAVSREPQRMRKHLSLKDKGDRCFWTLVRSRAVAQVLRPLAERFSHL